MLFKRAVDLSAYDDIRRLLTMVELGYHQFGAKDKAKLVLMSTWEMRVLFADEPFTRLEYVFNEDGTFRLDGDGRHAREKFVRMRANGAVYPQQHHMEP